MRDYCLPAGALAEGKSGESKDDLELPAELRAKFVVPPAPKITARDAAANSAALKSSAAAAAASVASAELPVRFDSDQTTALIQERYGLNSPRERMEDEVKALKTLAAQYQRAHSRITYLDSCMRDKEAEIAKAVVKAHRAAYESSLGL